MAKPDGGPAFGGEIDDVFVNTAHPEIAPFKFKRRVSGMSLRDYFAGQALAAIGDFMVAKGAGYGDPPDEIARKCYLLADAMLAERAKE